MMDKQNQIHVQLTNNSMKERRIRLIEQDPLFIPTEEEIIAYAEFMGMDPIKDKQFMHIAKEGLIASLPKGWCLAQIYGDDQTYFYNKTTNKLHEESPNDEFFINKFEEAKKLQQIKQREKQSANKPEIVHQKFKQRFDESKRDEKNYEYRNPYDPNASQKNEAPKSGEVGLNKVQSNYSLPKLTEKDQKETIDQSRNIKIEIKKNQGRVASLDPISKVVNEVQKNNGKDTYTKESNQNQQRKEQNQFFNSKEDEKIQTNEKAFIYDGSKDYLVESDQLSSEFGSNEDEEHKSSHKLRDQDSSYEGYSLTPSKEIENQFSSQGIAKQRKVERDNEDDEELEESKEDRMSKNKQQEEEEGGGGDSIQQQQEEDNTNFENEENQLLEFKKQKEGAYQTYLQQKQIQQKVYEKEVINAITKLKEKSFQAISREDKRLREEQNKRLKQVLQNINQSSELNDERQNQKQDLLFEQEGKRIKEEYSKKMKMQENEYDKMFQQKLRDKVEKHNQIKKNIQEVISHNDIIHDVQRKHLEQKFNNRTILALSEQQELKHELNIDDMHKELQQQQRIYVQQLQEQYEEEQKRIQEIKQSTSKTKANLRELYFKKLWMFKKGKEEEIDSIIKESEQIEMEKVKERLSEQYKEKQKKCIFKLNNSVDKQRIHLDEINNATLSQLEQTSKEQNSLQNKQLILQWNQKQTNLLEGEEKQIQELARKVQENEKLKSQIIQLKYEKMKELATQQENQKQFFLNISQLQIIKGLNDNSQDKEAFLQRERTKRVNALQSIKEIIKRKMSLTNQVKLKEKEGILLNRMKPLEKLYQNKQRSKEWRQILEDLDRSIDLQKNRVSQLQQSLKEKYLQIQNKKDKDTKRAERFAYDSSLSKQERNSLLDEILAPSKQMQSDYLKKVEKLKEKEKLTRKKQEQLLVLQKTFNKVMSLGLSEDTLVKEYFVIQKLNIQDDEAENEAELETFIASLEKENTPQEINNIFVNQQKDVELNSNNAESLKYKTSQSSQQKYNTGSLPMSISPDRETSKINFDSRDFKHQQSSFGWSISVDSNKNILRGRSISSYHPNNQLSLLVKRTDSQQRINSFMKEADLSEEICKVNYSKIQQKRSMERINGHLYKAKEEFTKQKQWCKDVKEIINNSLMHDQKAIQMLREVR